jgi:hypothetical protein
MAKRDIDRFPLFYVPVVARSANDEPFCAVVSTMKVAAKNCLIPPRGLLFKAVNTSLERWQMLARKGTLPFLIVRNLF